jgi:hypothetical protein
LDVKSADKPVHSYNCYDVLTNIGRNGGCESRLHSNFLNDIVVLIMIITRIDLFLSGFCRKNVTIKTEKTMKIVNAVSVLGTGTLQEH